MKKIYITKTLIEDSYKFDGLDFVLHEEFGFDYDTHEDFVVIRPEYGNADAFSVNIDDMIDELQRLKEVGSTHVELDYHCDHIGYNISGYEIRLSTEDEKIEADKTYKCEKEKEAKIRELYKEIENIKNQ